MKKGGQLILYILFVLNCLFYNHASNGFEKAMKEEFVYFNANSEKIDKSEKKKLLQIIDYLNKDPTAIILLHSYIDGSRNFAYNHDLSLRRVESIKEFLLDSDIDAQRIKMDISGLLEPHDKSQKAEASHNRKVKLTIYKTRPESYIEEIEVSDDNLRYYLLRLNGEHKLTESLTAYNFSEYNYISLEEFFKAMKFPIFYDQKKKSFTGWYINKVRKIEIDFANNIARFNNKEIFLDEWDYIYYEEEYLVNTKLLDHIFPLIFLTNDKAQILELKSTRVLPIEVEIIRKEKQLELANRNRKKKKDKQQVKPKYKLASLPFTNIALSNRYNSNKRESSKQTRLSYNMVGDLLWFNNRFSGHSEDGGNIKNIRLTSTRYDPTASQLWPLNASLIQLGDISSQSTELVSSGHMAKGLKISNKKRDNVERINLVKIEGDALPDWQVELYRNNYLINYQNIGEQGIYSFEDVELLSGVNVMKLIFHGPYGQIKEETKTYLLDNSLGGRNKIYYDISINKHGQSFIEDEDNDTTRLVDDEKDNTRTNIDLEYGATSFLSLLYNYTSIPLKLYTQKVEFNSLGIKSNYFNLPIKLLYANNKIDNSNAYSFSLRKNIFNTNLALKYERYDENFISEIKSSDEKEEYSLSVLGQLPYTKKVRYNLSSNIHLRFDKSKIINNNLSLSYKNRKFAISQAMNHSHSYIKKKYSDRVSANTNISTNIKKFRIIAKANYNIHPKLEVTNLTSNLGYDISRTLRYGLNSRYTIDNKVLNNGFNVTKKTPRFNLTCSFSADNRSNRSINISASTNIGYSPKNNKLIMHSQSMLSSGYIVARVFLDENSNDKYDEGEELLEGVGFSRNKRSTKKHHTNKRGIALLGPLTSYKLVKMGVSKGTLHGIGWSYEDKEYNIIPRPGSVDLVDFPIIITGDIEGVTYKLDKKEQRETSGVLVQLIDDKGEIYKEMLSAFDGFFIFEEVPLGKYTLRIDHSQEEVRYSSKAISEIAEENKEYIQKEANQYKINLNKDHMEAYGLEFLLEEKAAKK